MADLEDLLIRVNSELGDLNGIDSAISVLEKLKEISDKATKGAESLTQLANAFSTLNKEGKNTQGIQNLKSQVSTLTGVLNQLANHTKSANKTIKQLSDLGDALTKFANISESLKGLEGVSKGVMSMVDVLGALGGLQSVSKKASDSIKKTGDSIKRETDKVAKDLNASSKKLADAGSSDFVDETERDNRVLERKISDRRKLMLKLAELEEENYSARRNGDLGRAEELRIEAERYSKALKDSNRLIAQIDKYAQGNVNSANFNGSFEKSDAELKSLIEERESILNDYKNFTENFSALGLSSLDLNTNKEYQESVDDYQKELARLTTEISKHMLDMKSNVSDGLSQTFENNNIVDNFSKSTETLANSFDKVSLSADKAYKNIAMAIHAMANFGYGIDRNEQGALFNFPTDYASKIKTSENRTSIDTESLQREVIEKLKQTIDTDIHSHPEFDVASFSPGDIAASLYDFFENNIKQSLVTARKEISSFDMTKLRFADSYQDVISKLFENKITELARATFTPNLFEIDAVAGKDVNIAEYFTQHLLQPLEEWFGENNVNSNINYITKLFNDYFAEYKGLESIPLDSSVIADALSARLSSAFNTGNVDGLSDILSERINNIFYNVSGKINGNIKLLNDWQNLVKEALKETLSYLGEDVDNVYNSFSVNDYTKLLGAGIRPEELLQNNKELQSLIEQRRDIMTKLTDNSEISINDILTDGQIDTKKLDIREDALKNELQKVDEEISALKKKIIADATEKIDFEIPEVYFIEESNKELEALVRNRENIVVKLHELKERIATEDDTPNEAVNDKSKKEVFSEIAKRYEERITLIDEKINELKEKTIKSPQVDESSFEQVEDRLEEFYVRQKYLKEHLSEINKSGEKDSDAIVDLKTTEEQLSLVTGTIQRLEEVKNHLKPVNIDDAVKVDNSSEKVGTFADAVSNIKQAMGDLDAISQGIENLSKLGDALHSFNGLDENVKYMHSMAMGLRELIQAVKEADGISENDFYFIPFIKKALDALAGNANVYDKIGTGAGGLAQLIDVLDKSREMDLSKLDALKGKLVSLDDDSFKNVARELTDILNALGKAFEGFESTGNKTGTWVRVTSEGFEEAVSGLQNVRNQIEIISEDFDKYLNPLLNSRLIEILEQFRSMNDSYKNVSGIAQGLGSLLAVLVNMQDLKITKVNAEPLWDLLNALKQLGESGLVDEVAEKFEKFEGISDAMARLFNALKYFAVPLDPKSVNTPFGFLKEEIKKFNEEVQGHYAETRNLLYGFKAVFEALQKDSSVVKEDNLFEWLKVEIKELNDVVGEGGNIKVISNLLKGINDIAKFMSEGKGLNRKSPLFDDLKSKLQDLYNWSVNSGGGMIENFSKIASLLRSLNDLANTANQGIKFDAKDNFLTGIATAINNFDISAVEKLQQVEPVFKAITNLAKVVKNIGLLNDRMLTDFFTKISDGLIDINIATEGMTGVEKAINAVNRLVTTVGGANIAEDNNSLKTIGVGLNTVGTELQNIDGKEKAVNSLSKLINTVASSEVADTNSLSKVATSIKDISSIGNAKELGTLASNLNKLVETVANTKVDARKSSALDKIYSSIKKFDNLKSDMGQLSSLARVFSKLINVVAENDDKIGSDNVLTRIIQSLSGFKDIAENTKGLRGTLSAITSLIKVASEKVDFGKDNPLSQLKRILGGFRDITTATKGLDKVVKSLLQAIDAMKLVNGQDFKIDPVNNPFAVLKAQLESFVDIVPSLEGLPKILKALKDFAKVFEEQKGLKVNAQPIAELIGAVRTADGAQDAVNNFKNIIKAVRDASTKANASNLSGVAVALQAISDVIPRFANVGKLQSLIDVANAMVKMKDIDLAKFKEMANAIRDIMSALGSFNGNNNTIKITLDERGIINATTATNTAKKTWDDFKNDLLDDLATINFDGMFDMEGSTKHLKQELKKVQQLMDSALKERERWLNSMAQTERVKGKADAQESEGYRRAYSNYMRLETEASKYQVIIDALNQTLRDRNGYELENDAEGYRIRKSLSEEKERLEKMLMSMSINMPEMHIFGNVAEQNATVRLIRERIDDIDEAIERVNRELEYGVSKTIEGIQEQVRQSADEWDKHIEKVMKLNDELNKGLGNSASAFGNAFKNLPIVKDSNVLSSLGERLSKFGSELSSGKKVLPFDNDQLKAITKFVGGVQVVLGKIGQFVTFWVNLYKDARKVTGAIEEFTKKVTSFAKTMLSKVVGAFNAVAGAVGKAVSAVRSGAEGISIALRKLGDFGRGLFSLFGKLGGALAPALKGVRLIASLITPRIFKTLSNANFSLGQIIKKSRIISRLMKTATRWFTTMTRMLMRRSITLFLNQIKQAFEDLVVYEKNAGVAMLNLNTNVSKIFSAFRRGANQWIAAFEPLINAVTPVVLNFLNNVQAMGENVARFMAILTGQPYYIRAKQFYEDYGENVESTNKKVKDLTNSLDELNILNDSKDSDTGPKPEDMFEWVPVNGNLPDFGIPALKDIIDEIVDFLKNIPWEEIWAKIEAFIDTLMDYINYILSRLDLWEWLGKTLGNLINTLFVILEKFADKFDPKLLADAISTFIINALEEIDWDRIDRVVEKWATKLAQFWNYIFDNDKLWDSITKAITNFLNEVVHYFDTWAWTFDFTGLARQLTRSLTDILENFDYEQLRHAVEGWVTGLVNFVNGIVSNKTFWNTLGNSFAKLFNAVIVEGLKNLTGLDFTDLSDSIKLAIGNALKGIKWENLKASIETLAENLVKGINDFFGDKEFLTKVTTALANVGNIILSAIKKSLDTLKAEEIGKSIGTAIGNGLALVDWDKVFKLPADVVNKLSEALKGLFESLPEDFNLGTWLTEHLELTLDEIDWKTIEQNLENFRTQISNFISGVLQNQEFWEKAGAFTGKVIKIGLDLVFEFFNINGEDLGNAITAYINNLISEVNIGDYIEKTVDVFINLVTALDVTLTGINWKDLADQISQGIVDAVDKLFLNRKLFQKTIEDAFSSVSTILSASLTKMLENGSFYKIGRILGNIMLGFINGLATLLSENGDEITKAMKQFAKGLGDFIKQHHDEIVAGLNIIIHEICEIIKGFIDAKGDLFDPILDVLDELNLGEILGTLIYIAIRKAIAKIKITWSMIKGILQSFGGVINGFCEAIKPYLLPFIITTLSSLIAKWALGKVGELAGGALGGLIGSIFGPLGTGLGTAIGKFLGGKIFGAIGTALGAYGGAGLANAITGWFKGENGKGILDKVADAWDNFKKKLPWNKDKETAKVTIEPEVEVDDTDWKWDDYFDEEKTIPVTLEDPKLGTITAEMIEVEVLKPTQIETEAIYADFLYLGEIFADVLHVGEVDVDESLKGAYQSMDKFWGANEGLNINSGNLSKEDDDFLTKLEKLLDDFLTKLGELLDKELIALKLALTFAIEDHASVLNKFIKEHKKELDKFVKEHKKALNDFTKEFVKAIKNIAWDELGEKFADGFLREINGKLDALNFGNIKTNVISSGDLLTNSTQIASLLTDTINTNAIYTSLINTSEIIAGTLRVGTIEGSLSGFDGYDLFGGLGDTITKPTFEVGDRWSDISGAVASAEDFIKDLPDYYSGIYDTVSGGSVDNSDKNYNHDAEEGTDKATADADAMALAEKALSRNGYGNGGLYDWSQSDKDVQAGVKDLSTQMIDVLKQMADGSFLGGNYTSDDVAQAESLTWLMNQSENDRLRGKADSALVDSRMADVQAWLDGLNEKEQPKEDKGFAMSDFDEFHVTDDSTNSVSAGGKLPWLDGLVLQTEYTMAEVYNTIDKWLGRIWKLLKSFKAPNILDGILDGLKDIDLSKYLKLDGLEIDLVGKKNGILRAIERRLRELATLLRRLLSEGIKCHCDCNCGSFNKDLQDAIYRWIDVAKDTGHLDRNTEAKSANTRAVEAQTRAINLWIDSARDTGHLDRNTEAKSANTRAVEDFNNRLGGFIGSIDSLNSTIGGLSGTFGNITNQLNDGLNGFIGSLQGSLSNITCNCNCGGNCGNCAIGGKPDNNSANEPNNGGSGKPHNGEPTTPTNEPQGENITDTPTSTEGHTDGGYQPSTSGTSTTPTSTTGVPTPQTEVTVPQEKNYADNSNTVNGGTFENNKQEQQQGYRNADVFDGNTGITTHYDENGNATWQLQSDGKWGDKWFLNGNEVSEEEYYGLANQDYKYKDGFGKGTNTPVIDSKQTFTAGTKQDVIDAFDKQETDKVLALRDKAKSLYDTIQKSGDDSQKALAENYYKALMSNTGAKNAYSYEFSYNKLKDLADEVGLNELGDLKDARIGINGGIYSITKLASMEDGLKTLATIVQGSKDKNGSLITFFKKGNGSANSANAKDQITDAESINKIKSFIKNTYGITDDSANDLSAKSSNNSSSISDVIANIEEMFETSKLVSGAKISFPSGEVGIDPYTKTRAKSSYFKEVAKLNTALQNGETPTAFSLNKINSSSPVSDFENWYNNSFLVRGYQMGGIPNSGEIFVSRENGSPEYVGSFGNRTAVANNDQIVTAVANGVSMANDRVVSAIQNQTENLENTINNKDLTLNVGDRQIAEANNRGQKGMGNKFVQ